MKTAIARSAVLAFIGIVAAHALAGEAGAANQKQETAMPTDHDRIVAEVLRLFLKDVGAPETAKRRFSGEVTVLYVHATGGANVNLQDFANDAYRLKAASGDELKHGSCVDEETRRPCALVELSVISLNEGVATASVLWMQSMSGGGGLDYQLKKKGERWQIEAIVGMSSI